MGKELSGKGGGSRGTGDNVEIELSGIGEGVTEH